MIKFYAGKCCELKPSTSAFSPLHIRTIEGQLTGNFDPLLIFQPLQLNQDETAPYFLQLSQNLTLHCLLIYLNFPEFPSFCMMWSKNCSEDQNETILWSHHAKTGEFREIQLNQQTIRCQVLAWVQKIWSCLLFIKLYTFWCQNRLKPGLRTHEG